MDLLIDSASKYEIYYKQEINPIFHVACNCVSAQRVAFNVGRNIRKSLYELCGFPLTREAIINRDLTRIKNLTNSRIELLKNMASIDDSRSNIEVLNDYFKLKGFGKWSYGAVSILLNIRNDINLSSDSYIRKNISIYTESKMSEKECHDYINIANDDDKTKVCYLLWRIKPTSVNKIRNIEILTNEDFV